MKILLRKLGQHRGAPRLYLDTPDLADAGLLPGVGLRLQVDLHHCCLTMTADRTGARKVSGKSSGRSGGKARSCKPVPVIDLNSASDLGMFGPVAVVRIVITATSVQVSLLASLAKARQRHLRLQAKLASGQRLTLAGTAFGAGVASRALHEGLASAGVPCDLVLANEICEAYLDVAKAGNPTLTPRTALAAVPMQEAAADDGLLRHVGPVDILEAGIPCSGASKAGVSKRGLAKMEDHPQVGHLVAAVIQVIAALQPAIVVVENVEPYRHTASAAILRGWLRDAGYAVAESVLNGRDFGSLESRVRWFLVAHPPQVPLDLSEVASQVPLSAQGRLADVLETLAHDDPRYRRVEYLKAKADRDLDKGNGFGMQVLRPELQVVPVLRKGYHKGGSTDPRLLHPVDPSRSRLLTAAEHARIKGIDPAMLVGASETVAHQVCGQSVDTRPLKALAHRLAMALLVAEDGLHRGAAAPEGWQSVHG